MDDETHPAANRALHARAERAALEAYLAATATTDRRRTKLMVLAARRVFWAAGTRRDIGSFYAEIVANLVLDRIYYESQKKQS